MSDTIFRPDTIFRLRREAVLDVACSAWMGQYLRGLRLTPGNAEVAFDGETRRWTVHFTAPARGGRAQTGDYYVVLLKGKRRVFRVVIDDRSGTIIEQTILEDGQPAQGVGEAVAIVRASETPGAWLTRYDQARLRPEYRVYGGGWLIHVDLDAVHVGDVWVRGGRIVGSEGPWTEPPRKSGDINYRFMSPDFLRDAWLRLRPALSVKQVKYLLALVFLALVINWHHLRLLRTLDALVLAAFVPTMMLMKYAPAPCYVALMVGSVYVVARLAVRIRRPSPGEIREIRGHKLQIYVPGFHPLVTGVIVVAALAWQTANAHTAERTRDAYTDLLLGAQFFQRGYIPYGLSVDGEDTHGPLRYVLSGLVDQVLPSGAGSGAADTESEAWRSMVRLRGWRVVGMAFHLLAVAALIGLGKSGDINYRFMSPDFRRGLVWAAAYVVMVVALGRFFTASRVVPVALMVAGLWAFPHAALAGVCLGLATADSWFPIFLFPLWLGAHRGRDRLRFTGGYLGVGVLFFALAMLGPGGIGGRVHVLMRSVLQYQGVAPGLGVSAGADFWELLPSAPAVHIARQGLFFAYLVACVAAFWWGRRKPLSGVIAMTALLLAATQLWKPLNAGQYVQWYLPFAVIALFGPGRTGASSVSPEESPS